MSYKNERGYIGLWKGTDVTIVSNPSQIKNDGTIYIVANDNWLAVKDGYCIGEFDYNAGRIDPVMKRKYHTQAKKQEPEKKEKPVSTEKAVSNEPAAAVEDFKEYSKTVDEFFAALNAAN